MYYSAQDLAQLMVTGLDEDKNTGFVRRTPKTVAATGLYGEFMLVTLDGAYEDQYTPPKKCGILQRWSKI